jgi:hypothetical protein
MKRLIAVTSISLSFAFAIALANAEDNSVTTETTTESSTITQEPGTMGTDSSSTSDSKSGMSDKSSMSDSAKSSAKQSKSCTDENGMTYRYDEKGYKSCMKSMGKKHSDQMSGEAGVMSDTDRETSTTVESNTDESQS